MNPVTMIFVLCLGVLLFGKNLPDVARKVGLGLMEFKRGLNELKGTFDVGSLESPRSKSRSRNEVGLEDVVEERQDFLGTKFEPPSET